MTKKTATLIRLTDTQRRRIDQWAGGRSLAEFVRMGVDFYLESLDRRGRDWAEEVRLRAERRKKRPRKLERG